MPVVLKAFPSLVTAFVLTSLSLLDPGKADTRKVFCHLNVKSSVIKKTNQAARCQFSQFQGNAYVVMYPSNRSPLEFQFSSAKQGMTYQRSNHEGGIRFNTPELTLKVFWEDPGTSHRF